MKKTLQATSAFLFIIFLVACAGPNSYGEHEGSLLNFAVQKNVFLAYAGDIRTLEKVGLVALDGQVYVTKVTTLQGEKISSQIFSTGPSYLKTSVQSQYHFLPGKYIVEACFVMDAGNGSYSTCRGNVEVPLDVQAGSTVQWLLAF